MAEIGIPELLIILALVLVLVGPGRLAGLGAALGQSIRGFREAVRDPHSGGEQPQDGEELPR